MEAAGASPRWSLRKRRSVLYDQEMIDGDTSFEGLVDDDVCLSKRWRDTVKRKIRSQNMIKKLRPKIKTVYSGNCTAGQEYDPVEMRGGGKQTKRECVKINDATPRRSARCSKLSNKMMQIKKERQDDKEHDEDVQMVTTPVKSRKRMFKVKTPNNDKTRDQLAKGSREQIDCGIRRSSRIRKPTKEILEFRNALKDDENMNAKTHSSNQNKKQQESNVLPKSNSDTLITKSALNESPAASTNFSCERLNLGQFMTCNIIQTSSGFVNLTTNILPVTRIHPSPPVISNQSTKLPPPVRRKVFQPLIPDNIVRNPSKTKLCSTGSKTVPPASLNVSAVQVRPTEELLDARCVEMEDEASSSSSLPRTASVGDLSARKTSLLVLTEADIEDENEGDQLFPASLMKAVEDPRDWNCFQCVYELTKLDERLAIADLDPLLEKKVDGDALLKSSLSDLVNVVGLEYSPAVRVVFLVQQMGKDTSANVVSSSE